MLCENRSPWPFILKHTIIIQWRLNNIELYITIFIQMLSLCSCLQRIQITVLQDYSHDELNNNFLPTARVMTLSFSLTTFTTLLFCKGVTLQQSTERQRLARSMKRSCRSGDRAMARVRPSITREMSGVVSTLWGSAWYLLTSSSVQSRMDVQVICETVQSTAKTNRFRTLIMHCHRHHLSCFFKRRQTWLFLLLKRGVLIIVWQ